MTVTIETRLRSALADTPAIEEKRMFGGVCFMWRGHMLCGAGKQGALFRVGAEQQTISLAMPGVAPMIHAGRRMTGYVWLAPESCGKPAIGKLLAMSRRNVERMPPKKAKPTSRAAKPNRVK